MDIGKPEMDKISDKMRQDCAKMRKLKDVSSILGTSGRVDFEATPTTL